jgi:DNA-binding NtrC family response regulator
MNILIVDDDEGVLRLLEMQLAEEGYAVHILKSAQVALQHQLPVDDPSAHLLITDIVMPGLSGLDLDRALRARNPSMYTLFMSGYFPDAALQRVLAQCPRTSFLQKPFTPEQFVHAFRALLATG